MTRAFLAITPPIEIRQEISKIINILKSKFPAIAWENPEKIHLTLIFFGAIKDEKLSAVKSILSDLTKEQKQFELTIGNLSYFYKKHEDSIILLNINDQQGILRNFYQNLKEKLRKEEISIRERLSLHLTIGRLKRKRYPHEVKNILSQLGKEKIKTAGNFSVGYISLYESLYSKNLNTTEYRLLQSFLFESQ